MLMSYEQGLTFLHEKRVTGFNCSEPSSYMVDLSSAPRPVPLKKEAIQSFDRFSYPVRYYFVNFSKASRMLPGVADGGSPFQKDVKECGMFFDRIILNVSVVPTSLHNLLTSRSDASDFSKIQISHEGDDKWQFLRRECPPTF